MIQIEKDGGRLKVRIPDSRGLLQDYFPHPSANGLTFAKPSGEEHYLVRGPSGWSCSCKSFEHRHRRAPGRAGSRKSCKHCEAAELLDACWLLFEEVVHA